MIDYKQIEYEGMRLMLAKKHADNKAREVAEEYFKRKFN